MFVIDKKIIVITGGNGLLGKQIVSSLRLAGATVIAADIKVNLHDNLQVEMDITNEISVEKAIAGILKNYGRIDGWVNNAYPKTSDWGLKFELIPLSSWQKNVDMHLNGYFLCCQKVLEIMKHQKFGSLINMSSIYGIVGPDFNIYAGTSMTMPAAYAAIKGGIVNLTRYLAAYYGPSKIRVNTVSPGGIFDNQPESFIKSYENKVPLRKMGKPEDILGAIHYLLADESSYVTGHNLIIDGGWSII